MSKKKKKENLMMGAGFLAAAILVAIICSLPAIRYMTASERYNVEAVFSVEDSPNSWANIEDKGYEATWEYTIDGNTYTFITKESELPNQYSSKSICAYRDSSGDIEVASRSGFLGIFASIVAPVVLLIAGIYLLVTTLKKSR